MDPSHTDTENKTQKVRKTHCREYYCVGVYLCDLHMPFIQVLAPLAPAQDQEERGYISSHFLPHYLFTQEIQSIYNNEKKKKKRRNNNTRGGGV